MFLLAVESSRSSSPNGIRESKAAIPALLHRNGSVFASGFQSVLN
jgi:hypothetical protein